MQSPGKQDPAVQVVCKAHGLRPNKDNDDLCPVGVHESSYLKPRTPCWMVPRPAELVRETDKVACVNCALTMAWASTFQLHNENTASCHNCNTPLNSKNSSTHMMCVKVVKGRECNHANQVGNVKCVNPECTNVFYKEDPTTSELIPPKPRELIPSPHIPYYVRLYKRWFIDGKWCCTLCGTEVSENEQGNCTRMDCSGCYDDQGIGFVELKDPIQYLVNGGPMRVI